MLILFLDYNQLKTMKNCENQEIPISQMFIFRLNYDKYHYIMPMLNRLKVTIQHFVCNIAQGHTDVNVCLKSVKVVKI